ncbi:hypothetical protein PsorP6_016861 [Peronosclerospora sorghi]|uniref:Uncharacterized protein n=1 Tax=Peronosclerospora sorghi TaxID=230839 RepID=A0ACC0WCH3_9STRA|nr:hypothetical protein PsorP6_016861 [Peronosclerospora sorghi]
MTTTEFVDDDGEMGDVEHALAAADEIQIMNQPRADADEIKDEDDEEAEFKSDVKASAMEIDEVEEEKSKEINDTHRAVKGVYENTIKEDKGEYQDMEHKIPKEFDQYMEEKNAAEDNLIFTYKRKKGLVADKPMKALTTRFRDGKANRAQIQAFQHEVKEIQPQLFKLREQTSYSHKKIAKAEAEQKTLTKRQEQNLTEVEELKKDHAELDRAKA